MATMMKLLTENRTARATAGGIRIVNCPNLMGTNESLTSNVDTKQD